MEVLYERCCGIDVHKRIIVACFKFGRKQEIRKYGATSSELRKLANWLQENNCQVIGMESTGSYWKPLYNVFELSGLDAMVINAGDIKNVPGRKTDVGDAEWIADLVRHGLVRASYIPTREQRELREVSRYRISLVQERARELNRLQKILEGGNVKLGNIVSNINGVSARNILKAMLDSSDKMMEEEIKNMVYGPLRTKIPEIVEATDGFFSLMQKALLRSILRHIDNLDLQIAEINALIAKHMGPYEKELERLAEMPGIARQSAETILAEIGVDMSRFPTDKHISKWAGLCPGNNESAGIRKRSKTQRGNKTLKSTLVQCAVVAVKQNCYFKAQYQRISIRRGKKRALVAVAHSMLIAIYHMLKDDVTFKDLGSDYYLKVNKQSRVNYHLKQLTKLGWTPGAEEVA